MTTLKKTLCGAAVASLVAGTGAAVGTPLTQMGSSALDWMLAAEHVLLIGTDGTNLDKILQYSYTDTSGFKTLMDQAITGAATMVNHTTISGPSWSTILTGVWDNKHGVINNIFRPEPYNAWPTLFNLLEFHKPEIQTTMIADWDYMNGIAGAGGYPADNNIFVPFQNSWADTDAQVTAQTIAKILETTTNPDVSSFLFSYQVQVDEAGHGFGGGSPQYAQAVANVGDNIQQILAAVNQAKEVTGDDWTILVTTDHGHQQSHGFGHGFQSPNETSSFVIFDLAGNEANAGNQNLHYATVNITPTILQIFGVPLRSDFDGVPMQSDPAILGSIVDPVNLKQALNDAIAMFGYPNIGNDISLGARTVVATIPYLLNGAVTDISKSLQGIADQDIFGISALAGILQQVVQFAGGLVVGTTNDMALGFAQLTGSGVIPPSDPPLPPPAAELSGPFDAAVLAGHGTELSSLVDVGALLG